jgi:CubicO group peptidase (beta-lactamase class C family)
VTVRATPILLALVAVLALAAPAQAAKRCPEPGADWQRATPAEAGMDADKLADAMDYGTANLSFAVRVYRRGCLVGEDRLASENRDERYESWSLAKSVTAMVFGRAMTLGLISPDDVVGGLVTEADSPHGKIRMQDLLTMTSGLKWNGLRDYNIWTMPNRVVDALTLEPVHEPGTYYEYAQSAVSLLAEAIGRATGEDMAAFAQRELMEPLGIKADSWHWVRDRAGHVAGFMGVNMHPDDFGRLGELMRRGGRWRGRQLLSEEFVSRALAPSATNGCYGWLIWLNGKPCIGPTISERPVSPNRDMPGLPHDMYRFSGLFGQLVTVFPSRDLVMVRTGQDPSLAPTGGESWERGLYRRILGAITDEPFRPPATEPEAQAADDPNNDYGFHTSLREPEQYSKGVSQDPVPPAGPRRARAPRFELAVGRVSRTGRITLRVFCPPRPAGARCDGRAALPRTRSAQRWSIAAGDSALVRFTLRSRDLRKVRRAGRATLRATATNDDAAGGVTIARDLTLRGPSARKKRARR